LKRALFFEAAGAVSKFGRLSLAKSLKHTVCCQTFISPLKGGNIIKKFFGEKNKNMETNFDSGI
jgi:hypothetical protein